VELIWVTEAAVCCKFVRLAHQLLACEATGGDKGRITVRDPTFIVSDAYQAVALTKQVFPITDGQVLAHFWSADR
jgi:hypothetical protein